MENEMNITDAQYMRYDEDYNVSIIATIDGQVLAVPLDTTNRHYAEIMRQVEAGDLTIADAD
jgi:hypothetical protein